MKKLLSILVILCILLPSIVLAGYGYRIVVGQVSTGAGASCDSCSTSGLVLAWHCENSVDVTDGTAPYCGCSVLGDTTFAATGSPTFSAVDKSDGTYSILVDTAGEYYSLSVTQNAPENEGTIYFDVYLTNVVGSKSLFQLKYDSNDYISILVYGFGGDSWGFLAEHKRTGGGPYYAHTGQVFDVSGGVGTWEKWIRLRYTWDVDASSADHKLSAWELDSSSPRQTTGAEMTNGAGSEIFATWGNTPNAVNFGGIDIDIDGYMDRLLIYDTSSL